MNACVLSSPDVTAVLLVSAWSNAQFWSLILRRWEATLPQEQKICLSTKIVSGSPPTATISLGYCLQVGMKITRTLIYLRKRVIFVFCLSQNEPSSNIRSKTQDYLACSIFPFSPFHSEPWYVTDQRSSDKNLKVFFFSAIKRAWFV